MPSVYTSYVPADDDTPETLMKKLYLGIISLEEDLYTFNADLNEMRKRHATMDANFEAIKADFKRLHGGKDGQR